MWKWEQNSKVKTLIFPRQPHNIYGNLLSQFQRESEPSGLCFDSGDVAGSNVKDDVVILRHHYSYILNVKQTES